MARGINEELCHIMRKFESAQKDWRKTGDKRSARVANKLARKLSALERSA